jgi:hypothetical protein
MPHHTSEFITARHVSLTSASPAIHCRNPDVIDTVRVCTIFVQMKNITLSAAEDLIEDARAVAKSQRSTLNKMFREWLAEVAGRRRTEERLAELMARLDYVESGGPFTRDQLNER